MTDSTPATAATPAVRYHRHDNCPACREEHYEQAKADPVAAIVLDAMHQQDALTYNGLSDDMGQLALDAASKIRGALGA